MENTTLRDLCPVCGADRNLLRSMLDEKGQVETIQTPTGIGGCYLITHQYCASENHETARVIIDNCAACRQALTPPDRIKRMVKGILAEARL